MSIDDMRLLFDYLYWSNDRILDAAATVDDAVFVAAGGDTVRDLRGTLVHQLDVEWSWRIRLQGRLSADTGELRPEDFPALQPLRLRWQQDKAEMRAWLSTLTDDDLMTSLEPGDPRAALPLWHFLTHVQMHSAQSRADAATILTSLGHSPGAYDFLNFLDARLGHTTH